MATIHNGITHWYDMIFMEYDTDILSSVFWLTELFSKANSLQSATRLNEDLEKRLMETTSGKCAKKKPPFRSAQYNYDRSSAFTSMIQGTSSCHFFPKYWSENHVT